MPDVVGEIAESFTAFLARVWFGVGVDVEVTLVVRPVVESFAAEGAVEGVFPLVFHQMVFLRVSADEHFVAVLVRAQVDRSLVDLLHVETELAPVLPVQSTLPARVRRLPVQTSEVLFMNL